MRCELSGFAGQVAKDALGDVLRPMGVEIDLSQSRRIHEVDVSPDKPLKRRLGTVAHISLKQFAIGHVHFSI
jgi:hypothetical protein